MKIKNVMVAVGTAGVISASVLSGCGAKEDNSSNNSNEEQQSISYDAFSQTISEVVDINKNEITQLDGHLGYQPVAISLETYGKLSGRIDDGCIYFVNNEEVISNINQFGETVSSTEEVNDGEFLPYQHILLVPIEIDSNFEENTTYPYHEGYQIVGADTVTYGQLAPHHDDTYLLYTNTETVKCVNYSVEDGKTESTEFGTPVEKNKVLEKE